MKLTPHFTFDLRAKEALAFYTSALKGKTEIVYTYRDCGVEAPAGSGGDYLDKIMYASLSFGDGNMIAICDMCPENAPEKAGNTVFMDLELKAEEVKPIFDALAENGTILCPLSKMSWTEQFGCLVDKFGINWNIMQEEESK